MLFFWNTKFDEKNSQWAKTSESEYHLHNSNKYRDDKEQGKCIPICSRHAHERHCTRKKKYDTSDMPVRDSEAKDASHRKELLSKKCFKKVGHLLLLSG